MTDVHQPAPKGLSIEQREKELRITLRWFEPVHIFLAVFGLFFSGIILLALISTVAENTNSCTMPFTCVGFGLIYYALTGFFNYTIIHITPDWLNIDYKPLPSFARPKQLAVKDIKQLYVKQQTKSLKDKGEHKINEVWVITNAGKRELLLPNVSNLQQAMKIEQVIEQFLDLQDTPVPGEFNPTAPTAPNAHLVWSGWRNIAAEHRLSITSDKSMGGFGLSGDYREKRLNVFISNISDVLFNMRVVLEPKWGDISTPAPIEREDIKKLFEQWPSALTGQVRRKDNGRALIYEQTCVEPEQKDLQRLLDNLHDLLVIYPQIVRLGGEVVTVLAPFAAQKDFITPLVTTSFSGKNHPLRQIAVQLLTDIAQQTQSLAPHAANLYCRRCLTRCVAHPIDLGVKKLHFYGCRACRQSRDFLTAGQIVAVLDDRLEPEPILQEKSLRVNWLARRQLFDFDGVEIIHATDEDVERFAVQVGNDTDPLRQSRYPQMHCLTATDCHFSENTRRILQRTFGKVEVF